MNPNINSECGYNIDDINEFKESISDLYIELETLQKNHPDLFVIYGDATIAAHNWFKDSSTLRESLHPDLASLFTEFTVKIENLPKKYCFEVLKDFDESFLGITNASHRADNFDYPKVGSIIGQGIVTNHGLSTLHLTPTIGSVDIEELIRTEKVYMEWYLSDVIVPLLI